MHSQIYTVNSSSQLLLTGDTISLGSTVRRYGCNCILSGNSIVIDGAGLYTIDATITGSPTLAGTVTVAAFKDGVAIPGATASVETTSGATVTLPIIGVTREKCCCCESPSEITFVMTGSAGTITNIAVKVSNE